MVDFYFSLMCLVDGRSRVFSVVCSERLRCKSRSLIYSRCLVASVEDDGRETSCKHCTAYLCCPARHTPSPLLLLSLFLSRGSFSCLTKGFHHTKRSTCGNIINDEVPGGRLNSFAATAMLCDGRTGIFARSSVTAELQATAPNKI